MKSIQDNYPFFEANQVLSDTHLNQAFDYLEEQQRLTRANLIGIGIVCGLEIELEVTAATTTLHLTRGCGVTSQGYLIVEGDDVALRSYREYTLPDDPAYAPFRDGDTQYPLWELFPAGEPDSEALDTPADFLDDKAVLLFLELDKQALRNCSPNDCNDKGSELNVRVRRLLITTTDLQNIIAAGNDLAGNLSADDFEAALLSRLNLPDLRLPRYAVPNTAPVTANDLLDAFHAVFRSTQLVSGMQTALSAAYSAFEPLLQALHPNDPFSEFSVQFGFLEDVPENSTQVRFLPYYYDFFDDLLKAYDEFRWAGVELLCACCPPGDLFPRHLTLGVLLPESVSNPSLYRQRFLASPATGACEQHTRTAQQLFQRLVQMIENFSNNPPLAQPSDANLIDVQIRITPSKLADTTLSDKAIPYYYLQDGTPPLYQLWNAEKTRRNRAAQNLGYRSDEYQPPAPAFVLDALNYDLEPYNFLRIEGHLGKPYQSVLNTLLTLKTRHRLPVEIIALRSGVFDENMAVDPEDEECHFHDLEALYDALREELLHTLSEGARYFYSVPVADLEQAEGAPELPLLQKYAPNFRYPANSVGAWYERYLTLLQEREYIDVDQNDIDNNEVLGVYCILFTGTTDLPPENYAHVVSVYYLSKLAEVLPDSLDRLGFADFENKYQDLIALIRFFRNEQVEDFAEELQPFIPQEELIDQFDHVLFSCKLEAIAAVYQEYEQRIREVKQKRFLSFFLQKNPGIQHKAGVPLGGTFIIVYHERATPSLSGSLLGSNTFTANVNTPPPSAGASNILAATVSDAIARISINPELLANPDIRSIIGVLTGQVPDPGIVPPPAGDDRIAEIIANTIDELSNGTVIADFFLPYLCCSDCAPVQYVLPRPPLGLTIELGCTAANGSAEVRLIPQGGIPPYTYQLDGQAFEPLSGNPLLTVGAHTIVVRDSAGSESLEQSLSIPQPLNIGTESYTDDSEAGTYQVGFSISGGTPPYTGNGTITGDTYISAPVESGEAITVTITDDAGCEISREFSHTVEQPCTLPCDGQSRRCAYRLWLQPPFEEAPYEMYGQMDRVQFRLNGEEFDLPDSDTLLQIPVERLNADFDNAIGAVVNILNEAINQRLIERFGDELGNNRFVISYEPGISDPFAVLRIEYFVCETFNLEFGFTYSQPSPVSSLRWRYTNEADDGAFNGAIMINNQFNTETRVRAFDCSERNQCSGTDFEPLCRGPNPEPEIVFIERLGNNRFEFAGTVTNLDESEISGWVWDVIEAQPTEPFYEGIRTQASLQQPRGPIRLTVITTQGCFGSTTQFLDQ